MNKNLLPIAKFGVAKISYALILLVVFLVLDFDVLSFITFVITLALVYIYRNPEREVVLFEKNSVVTPCDGTVVSIEELENEEYAYKVTIENNFKDVGVLRAPMNSKLTYVKLTRGAKTSVVSPLFEKINENATLVFEDENTHKVKIVHRMKQNLDNLSVDALSAQMFAQGTRYGFMANGVTTIYLPQNFRLSLNIGNEVEASQTLIGYFS